MENESNSNIISKAKNLINTAKTYWHTPPKGNYIPYKEVASLSGAGFGVHWTTLLSSTIGLNAGNFLVGASIGLEPMDLQIMLNIANIIGIPIGIFRAWYYDNHNLKGGKFLPFIRLTSFPIVLISLLFVWLPYEHFEYSTKVIVVWFMYFFLSFFSGFYSESYTYFQQIISPDAQERATVMSISQVVYSLAPTITGFLLPTLAALTWGNNNIWTYRIIYPIFTIVGLIISTVFFRKVKERLVLPRRKPEPVRMLDAIREVAKNKYYWIIQAAGWVVFLESGYGVVLGWSFVYANGGDYEKFYGLATTIIGNASLWSMLLAPLAIKKMGKRNLLITANSINIVVLIVLYFVYKNILLVCVLWYFNTFINTFWNIVQHNISADMRDYHQWKTGVRVDGLFGPLGMIGTVIGLFTGMVYPAIYEKMGLKSDYNILYDDNMRNNLFEVLILFSVFGALLNLIPFIFYDLTENKHKAYIHVLKIRAMFENHALGVLEDGELEETMEIIHEAQELFGKEKLVIDKTALNKAKQLPHKTKDEKQIRKEAIKKAKAEIQKVKETNLAIERSAIIMEDVNKFSGEVGRAKIMQAQKDVEKDMLHYYEDVAVQMRVAKNLPKKTATEKAIRADAIKNVRIKKESATLIKKYGIDNIKVPDESVKEELLNRETHGFVESLKVKQELRAYLKYASVYARVIKPYTEAKLLLTQAENYTHYEELEREYVSLKN